MSRNPNSIARAQRERKAPSLVEEKLWELLRGRRYRGEKFRRQHAVGPYVVDFACAELRLVVEVDGHSHYTLEQKAFDAERTAFLEKAGWRVARISNVDVLWDVEGLQRFLDAALGFS